MKILRVKGIVSVTIPLRISSREIECKQTAKSFVWERPEGHYSATRRLPIADLDKIANISDADSGLLYQGYCLPENEIIMKQKILEGIMKNVQDKLEKAQALSDNLLKI